MEKQNYGISQPRFSKFTAYGIVEFHSLDFPNSRLIELRKNRIVEFYELNFPNLRLTELWKNRIAEFHSPKCQNLWLMELWKNGIAELIEFKINGLHNCGKMEFNNYEITEFKKYRS